VLGDYAARSDVEAQQVKKFKVPPFEKAKLWVIDPAYVYDTRVKYAEFYMGISP
jgi:hypothetical protein